VERKTLFGKFYPKRKPRANNVEAEAYLWRERELGKPEDSQRVILTL
jgi:hypothetical protein